MKKKIIVLLAAFVCLLTTLFTAGMVKTYAASTPYSLATYFTFSCDMDIDKGFELIKPYILYRNDSACFENYTFKAEEENDGFYRYTGTYPDGTPFSIHSKIRIINDPSGTYVEALNFEATRQSIVVTSLRSGKKTSDCLNECWKNRYICVKDPTYYMETGFAPAWRLKVSVLFFSYRMTSDQVMLKSMIRVISVARIIWQRLTCLDTLCITIL